SGVGQIGATLNATVNAKGHVLGKCEFEYTDDADFQANGFANATSVPCPNLVGEPEAVSVSAQASSLATATKYDFHVVVASNGGSTESATQPFEPLPPLAPDVKAGDPSSVTQTGATLTGSVNAHGGTISNCHFEYTDEASFQTNGFTTATSKICSPS